MAGVACVEHILKHRHDFQITILGDETHGNYNRILLSSVLAGERTPDEIVLHDPDWYHRNNVRLRLGVRAASIDRERHFVIREDGEAIQYDNLILATGSRAWIPPIEGVHKKNVFVFRTLDDTRALIQ